MLALTTKPKVWKVMKKELKNWPHELKCAVSHYCQKESQQGESRTPNFVTSDFKRIAYATISMLVSKLSILFQPCHVRRICCHYLKCTDSYTVVISSRI